MYLRGQPIADIDHGVNGEVSYQKSCFLQAGKRRQVLLHQGREAILFDHLFRIQDTITGAGGANTACHKDFVSDACAFALGQVAFFYAADNRYGKK